MVFFNVISTIKTLCNNFMFLEKGDGEHQHSPSPRHEVWKILPRFEADIEDTPTGES